MTTDKQPRPFEEWLRSWDGGRASRDAEIADLKRQVAAAEEAGYEEGWNDCSGPDYNEKRGPKGALDTVLADARRKGAEEMRERAAARFNSLSRKNYWIAEAIRALPLDAPASPIGGKGKP